MARKRNVIVYLETGLGKTLIAVLLIKDTANRLRDPLKKRVAVFLVPKVILAEQVGVTLQAWAGGSCRGKILVCLTDSHEFTAACCSATRSYQGAYELQGRRVLWSQGCGLV